jgi:hypothetical protein
MVLDGATIFGDVDESNAESANAGVAQETITLNMKARIR